MHTKKLFDLSHKIAIVTGGTGLFGKPIAFGLAEAGATVIIASRDVEKCRAVAREIVDEGFLAEGMKLDLASENNIREFTDAVLKRYKRIDVLVNNAVSREGYK